MKPNDWKAVLARLKVEDGPLKPLSMTTLKQYEKKIGIRLPKSYKNYCCTIGPGELVVPHCYRICVPDVASNAFNIEKINTDVRSIAGIDLMAADPVQYKRGLYFGTDISTSDYFWDPQDITDPKNNEYGIYVRYRNWQVDRLCDTFWEFINDICLGKGNPTQDNSLGVELVFTPFRID